LLAASKVTEERVKSRVVRMNIFIGSIY
jgi:hypothetical protein